MSQITSIPFPGQNKPLQTTPKMPPAKIALVVFGILSIIASLTSIGLIYTYTGSLKAIYALNLGIIGVGCVVGGCLRVRRLPIKEAIVRKPGETAAQWRAKQCKGQSETALVHYSFIQEDPSRVQAKEKVSRYLCNPDAEKMSPQEQRAMGIMLGMACGDSVGAPYEFLAFNPKGHTTSYNRFELEEGQWTDDTSMGLCLADALIEMPNLDERQLMWAFTDWWEHGYNNAFTGQQPRSSVGLGGNINQSFKKFTGDRGDAGTFATDAGNDNTSGNGSLMRLGPVAIVAKTEQEALGLARRQSKVTHQGEEAGACCELMAFLLFHALHAKTQDADTRKKEIFEKLENYQSPVLSVTGLAHSLSSVLNPDTHQYENWDWKNTAFSFNEHRLKDQPGYIGSYAMDGLAMALHCVYTTHSFEEAVLKSATRGGDADTVGAITGQIAGAIYGVNSIPKDWRDAVHQWDRGGEIATRGYLLCQNTSS